MTPLETLIVVLVFALGPLVFAGSYYLSKRKKTAKSKKKERTSYQKSASQNREDIENEIGIDLIKDNIIKQKDGGYSIVLEYSTPDYGTMKSEEQNLFEAKLARAVLSMKKKFKIVEYAGGVKTVKANARINKTISMDVLTPEATNYALKLSQALKDKRYDMTIQEKKRYMVVGSYKGTPNEAIDDIRSQIKSIYTAFTKAETKIKLLNTTEIIGVQNELINYNTKMDIESLENTGIFELFSTGGK